MSFGVLVDVLKTSSSIESNLNPHDPGKWCVTCNKDGSQSFLHMICMHGSVTQGQAYRGHKFRYSNWLLNFETKGGKREFHQTETDVTYKQVGLENWLVLPLLWGSCKWLLSEPFCAYSYRRKSSSSVAAYPINSTWIKRAKSSYWFEILQSRGSKTTKDINQPTVSITRLVWWTLHRTLISAINSLVFVAVILLTATS